MRCPFFFPPWRNECKIVFIFRGTPAYGNGNKIKRQLVACGDYSSMANCWTIISRDMRCTFVIFCGVSKHLYTYSNIFPRTPGSFCGNFRFRKSQCGKHLFKVLSPLFIQLMHINYYKIVEQLKSFKITIVAPTCFGLHKPLSGSSQPVLRCSYNVDFGYISLFEAIGIVGADLLHAGGQMDRQT